MVAECFESDCEIAGVRMRCFVQTCKLPRVLRANSFGPVREVGSAIQFLSPKPWNL